MGSKIDERLQYYETDVNNVLYTNDVIKAGKAHAEKWNQKEKCGRISTITTVSTTQINVRVGGKVEAAEKVTLASFISEYSFLHLL